MIVARKLWCQCSVCSLIESLCIIPPLTLFYSIVHSLTLWYTILHDNTLSYTILHYYTLSYTISHYFTLCFSHCRRETSVWIMWKLIDFNLESRKEKQMRKLFISCLVQKMFSALQITKSQIKKEEIDERASEKASHPS